MIALGAIILGASLALPAALVAAQDTASSPEDQTTTTAEPPTAPPPDPTAQPTEGPSPSPPTDSPSADASASQAASRPTRSVNRTSSPTVAASNSSGVSIVGTMPSAYAFSPGSITVQAGNTVTWKNSSSAPEGHTVNGDGLDSGTLHQGQSYSHTFKSAGTFNYVCNIHPSMKGTVVVNPAPSGGGSGGRGGAASANPSSGNGGGGGSTTDAGGGTTSTSGPGSESAAGDAPGAAGSSTKLPMTGLDALPQLVAGLIMLAGGVALRRLAHR